MIGQLPNTSRISKPAYHSSVLLSRFTWWFKGLLHHFGDLYQTPKGGASRSSVSNFTRLFQDGIDLVIGTFAVYLLANIGLGFSNSFAALMVFRGIQAAGSAATISVGRLVLPHFRDQTTKSV
jgi:hypothetical protein